jgi:hypothetical protein
MNSLKIPKKSIKERHTTYSKMEDEDCLRKYYAKCLAKLQIEFIKDRNPRVKDLIRLLKYWKYTENNEKKNEKTKNK